MEAAKEVVNEQAVKESAVRGTVKWFGETYGFLVPESGQGDVFCHWTAIEGDEEEFKKRRERLGAGTKIFGHIPEVIKSTD